MTVSLKNRSQLFNVMVTSVDEYIMMKYVHFMYSRYCLSGSKKLRGTDTFITSIVSRHLTSHILHGSCSRIIMRFEMTFS